MGRHVQYNPKMQADWQIVLVADVMGKQALELYQWCEKTCHGRFTRGRALNRATWRYCNEFRFKNKNDAMLFKLTWGGDI